MFTDITKWILNSMDTVFVRKGFIDNILPFHHFHKDLIIRFQMSLGWILLVFTDKHCTKWRRQTWGPPNNRSRRKKKSYEDWQNVEKVIPSCFCVVQLYILDYVYASPIGDEFGKNSFWIFENCSFFISLVVVYE